MILYTGLQIGLIILLYFSKKFSSVTFDIIVSMAFVGLSIWLFILYQDSLDNKLKSLGDIVYLIAVTIVSFIIILIIAYIQKRWFLSTPIVLLFVFWLGDILLEGYNNTQKITSENFGTKFPQIQKSIQTNDVKLLPRSHRLDGNAYLMSANFKLNMLQYHHG